MPLSVLLVDDHRAFADVMRLALDAQPDLRCVGIAHSAAEADALIATTFDAAIVDLGLPDGDGATVVEHLLRRSPTARIVVLTAHPRSDLARQALAAGAHRVLPKRGSFDEVLRALREPAGAAPDHPAPHPLTPREREVLGLLARGNDVSGIAGALGLSAYTVRDHVKAILAALGARTQLEAVIVAARSGLVVVEPE